MVSGKVDLEPDLIAKIRSRYEQKGYEVIIEPRQEDLPEFLQGYVPDVIARKPNEQIVVEIKSPKRAAARSALVEFLAREVPKHEGWKFDLVLEPRDVLGSSMEPSIGEIRMALTEVKMLSKESNYKAALLLAWGLLEAATRRVAFDKSDDKGKRFLPRTVAEQLISKGFVDDETGRMLLDAGRLRTQVAHGFVSVDVSSRMVKVLIATIEMLLESGHTGRRKRGQAA